MSLWRAAQVSLRPLSRASFVQLHAARAFALSTQNASARVTDAAYQKGSVIKEPPKMRQPEKSLQVPEVTPEQKEAAAALKAAQKEATDAKTAAAEATTVANVLKTVADDAAEAKKKADARVSDAQKAAEEAMLKKRLADQHAIQWLQSSAEKEKQFLKNAFATFDTNQKGFLTRTQMETVLRTLKQPAESGDVDDLVQIMDVSKDDLVQQSEWVKYMPDDMKQVLLAHPLAAEWAPAQ